VPRIIPRNRPDPAVAPHPSYFVKKPQPPKAPYVARYRITSDFMLQGWRWFNVGMFVTLDNDPELADVARKHPERFQLVNPKP
jgi:hypothetical protein